MSAARLSPRVVAILDGRRVSPPEVEILTGVPTPPRGRAAPRWPLHRLAVGQAFVAEGPRGANHFYDRARRLGIKLEVRRLGPRRFWVGRRA